MRKWRPTFRCIYVIPEVRGNLDSLEVIFNRILPLRIFENQEDTLVMLGNYIDGDSGSDKVLDCLISIKNEYKDRVVFLRGKHEDMMLSSLKSDQEFAYWLESGGISTVNDYAIRAGLNINPYSLSKNRLVDLIPKAHFEFMSNLDYYKIIGDYCFLYSGFNPNIPVIDNKFSNFIYDTSSSKYVKECFRLNKDPSFKDPYVFVTSNNLNKEPSIYGKYFMLGGLGPERLVVFELNSMTASAATRGKSRIYKYDFNICE